MMGRQDEPAQLFYKFSLDRHVPADHLLRQIDAVLDLSTIRRTLAPYYATGGRPSIDPELMIRMLLVGYAFAIRSKMPVVRGGASQPRLSLVLPPWPGGQCTGPLDFLKKSPRPFP